MASVFCPRDCLPEEVWAAVGEQYERDDEGSGTQTLSIDGLVKSRDPRQNC
jgi:hypothetical protein